MILALHQATTEYKDKGETKEYNIKTAEVQIQSEKAPTNSIKYTDKEEHPYQTRTQVVPASHVQRPRNLTRYNENAF